MSRAATACFWLLPLVLLALAGCGSASSAPADGDRESVTPALDGDTSEAEPEAEEESETTPTCYDLCAAYCTLSASCGLTTTASGCTSDCQAKLNHGTLDPLVACGVHDTCAELQRCLHDGGSATLPCTGLPSADGDSESEAADTESAASDGPCTSDADCLTGTACNPYARHCAPLCDPDTRSCTSVANGVCLPLTAAFGVTRGVCVAPFTGLAVGAACSPDSGTPCQSGTLCGDNGVCETLCRAGDSTCAAPAVCTDLDTYKLSVCPYCLHDAECASNRSCQAGACVLTGPCLSRDDCAGSTACFAGLCEAGCRTNDDCLPGLCLTASGYCKADICAGSGATGQCCSGHHWGPCCTPACGGDQTCAYDPSCGNALACCVTRHDCRQRPLGYCGSASCDRLTGDCCVDGATCTPVTGAGSLPYTCPTLDALPGSYTVADSCGAPFVTLHVEAGDAAGCHFLVTNGAASLAELTDPDTRVIYDTRAEATSDGCLLLFDGPTLGFAWACLQSGHVCREAFALTTTP